MISSFSQSQAPFLIVIFSPDVNFPLYFLQVGASVKRRHSEKDSQGRFTGGDGNFTEDFDIHESLAELARLAESANLQVTGSTYQQLQEVNPRTYVGVGKVEEICTYIAIHDVDTVIFDDELSPGQLRNLERAFTEALHAQPGGEDREVRVCDRTALILDIFSQRARTKEGKLQVEMALTEYQLPRLTKMWSHLERQAGRGGSGGAVKGMGESQKAVDRFLLKKRLAQLRRELDDVRRQRGQVRKRREQKGIPVIALVGYTNAGKSTLLNRISGADVYAQDQLFATLDPTTRRVRLGSGQEALFTDTVGFIQRLPTQLVAAFRATLEEIEDASLILHVVDISSSLAEAQVKAVDIVLSELDIGKDIPQVVVWNKVDACDEQSRQAVEDVAASLENTTWMSAHTGENEKELLTMIENVLADKITKVRAILAYKSGAMLDEVHQHGVVLSEEFLEEGTEIVAKVSSRLLRRLREEAIEVEELWIGEDDVVVVGDGGQWDEEEFDRVEDAKQIEQEEERRMEQEMKKKNKNNRKKNKKKGGGGEPVEEEDGIYLIS